MKKNIIKFVAVLIVLIFIGTTVNENYVFNIRIITN